MTGRTVDRMTSAPELAKLIRDLNALPPWERVVASARIVTELRDGSGAIAMVRRAALVELLDGGLSMSEAGDLTGLSASQVHQMTRPTLGERRKVYRARQAAAAIDAAEGSPEAAGATGDAQE
jgi:hypothetical protein